VQKPSQTDQNPIVSIHRRERFFLRVFSGGWYAFNRKNRIERRIELFEFSIHYFVQVLLKFRIFLRTILRYVGTKFLAQHNLCEFFGREFLYFNNTSERERCIDHRRISVKVRVRATS
jgi:hypothetical protein